MAYSAKILLDSVSPTGSRLTTMEITYPRFVHSEFMTHRVFSRNAASSRAIPVAKMIQRVMDDPAMPVEWGLNQPGMQASQLADETTEQDGRAAWLRGRNSAVRTAENLNALGLHKQVVNRVLEPYMWMTVIVTGTDYQGFFDQRASRYSPLAQPELRRVADMMLELYEASQPSTVDFGAWHLPFIQPDELELDVELLKKISAARCGRVSYLNHDGVKSIDKDLELYNRLVGARPIHASPFEHVATPRPLLEPAPGNLRDWRQMRHAVEVLQRGALVAG